MANPDHSELLENRLKEVESLMSLSQKRNSEALRNLKGVLPQQQQPTLNEFTSSFESFIKNINDFDWIRILIDEEIPPEQILSFLERKDEVSRKRRDYFRDNLI